MNNIKVAKQLIKLAKSLIAFKEDETITQKSVKEQIMEETNISKIDKLIKENYPNKYEDVTEDEWMHIFDMCKRFAYDQVVNGQSMNQHDVNDVMNIFRSKIWDKIKDNNFKTHNGKNIDNLQQYLFGSIKYIAKRYKEVFYLHGTDKATNRDISIEENELQNYIDNNSFEEADKLEKEKQYNEALNILSKEIEKLKNYKINDFKKRAPIKNNELTFFDIYEMYYDQKMAMEDIAKELGIKYAGVQQLFKHINKTLKNKLNIHGINEDCYYDNVRTSSDFLEDLLNDKKLWQKIK